MHKTGDPCQADLLMFRIFVIQKLTQISIDKGQEFQYINQKIKNNKIQQSTNHKT